MVATFTIDSFKHWQWASNSVYYLLSLWSRLVASMPYLKGSIPSQVRARPHMHRVVDAAGRACAVAIEVVWHRLTGLASLCRRDRGCVWHRLTDPLAARRLRPPSDHLVHRLEDGARLNAATPHRRGARRPSGTCTHSQPNHELKMRHQIVKCYTTPTRSSSTLWYMHTLSTQS